jgi:hypothetical protein
VSAPAAQEPTAITFCFSSRDCENLEVLAENLMLGVSSNQAAGLPPVETASNMPIADIPSESDRTLNVSEECDKLIVILQDGSARLPVSLERVAKPLDTFQSESSLGAPTWF